MESFAPAVLISLSKFGLEYAIASIVDCISEALDPSLQQEQQQGILLTYHTALHDIVIARNGRDNLCLL